VASIGATLEHVTLSLPQSLMPANRNAVDLGSNPHRSRKTRVWILFGWMNAREHCRLAPALRSGRASRIGAVTAQGRKRSQQRQGRPRGLLV